MPLKYVSIITDGMMQAYCYLPWYGNFNSSRHLPQHIQGVLSHGRDMNVFRTYHNVFNGANLQLHTLLLTLESILKPLPTDDRPDTLYIQIDGGSENSAKELCGMTYDRLGPLRSQPAPTDDEPRGMYILESLPEGAILP